MNNVVHPRFGANPTGSRPARTTPPEHLPTPEALPSPLPVVATVMRLAAEPDVAPRVLARAVAADPALTAELLRTANSAASGLRYTARTAEQAVTVLGTRAVRNLVLSFAVRDAMRRSRLGSERVATFWEDSLRRAVAARLLAANLHVCDPEEAFIVGLLLEFGSFSWFSAHPKEGARWEELRVLDPDDRRIREHVELGVTHDELGAQLTESLGLPRSHVAAIRHHHDPSALPRESGFHGLCHVAMLADLVSAVFSVKDPLPIVRRLERNLSLRHNVSSTTVGVWLDDVGAEVDAQAERLGMRVARQPAYRDLVNEARRGWLRVASDYERITDDLQHALADQEQVAGDLVAANERLDELAHRDALTGLANRRRFDEEAARLLVGSALRGAPCSLLVADIDHFKSVNDHFGHATGDRVLQMLGSLLSRRARTADLVARIGGEEFVLVLPDTGEAGARTLAQALCDTIRAELGAAVPGRGPITATIGGTSWQGPVPNAVEAAAVVADLLAQADRALYAGKHAGRDRVAWSRPRPG